MVLNNEENVFEIKRLKLLKMVSERKSVYASGFELNGPVISKKM